MNLKMRAAALLMTLGMTAGMFSGCSAEKSGFDYSEGYDEDGRWTQVTALDYVTLPDYTWDRGPQRRAHRHAGTTGQHPLEPAERLRRPKNRSSTARLRMETR